MDRARFVSGPRVAASWVGESIEIRELRQINRGRRHPSPEDREVIVGAYDGEIRSMDRALGRLVEGLENRRLSRRTVLVFTSDHGEELGEHGKWGRHADTLYDELLRVPLIIYLPDGDSAGESIGRQVRSIDIAPTILDALGLEIPREFRGRSLLGLARGERAGPLVAVSMRDQPDEEGAPFASVRTERWKLIAGMLYDLRRDPAETGRPLVNRMDVSLRLQKILENANGLIDHRRQEGVTLDAETQERLEALGYL
jgi:arylsulfatase A-like enzyme